MCVLRPRASSSPLPPPQQHKRARATHAHAKVRQGSKENESRRYHTKQNSENRARCEERASQHTHAPLPLPLDGVGERERMRHLCIGGQQKESRKQNKKKREARALLCVGFEAQIWSAAGIGRCSCGGIELGRFAIAAAAILFRELRLVLYLSRTCQRVTGTNAARYVSDAAAAAVGNLLFGPPQGLPLRGSAHLTVHL